MQRTSNTPSSTPSAEAREHPRAGVGLPRSYPLDAWRLIVDGQVDGATNMAVDEAILDAVAAGTSLPTLRFYAWSPPCLSLGRNQPLADVDLEACRSAGVDVVRRPTGGRAILHTDELTYSVVLLQTDPRAAGGVVGSYRRLSEGLLAGLRCLGLEVVRAIGQRERAADLTAVCFDMPSEYEITALGCKLVGSAQWRAKGGVLQHGTLPLKGDITRVVELLALSDNERVVQRQALLNRASTLERASGQVLAFAEVAQALGDGFAQALHLDLVPGVLSSQEHARSAELRRDRYAARDWTEHT